MKIEKQVCSRESGEKLRALGVTVESYFFWADRFYNGVPLDTTVFSDLSEDDSTAFENVSPAYTVAELMEAAREHTADLSIIYQTSGKWLVAWEKIGESPKYFYSENLADALSNWIIWLIEQKHVSVEEVNR